PQCGALPDCATPRDRAFYQQHRDSATRIVIITALIKGEYRLSPWLGQSEFKPFATAHRQASKRP
ncbi:MAG: hypothetical protein EBY55_13875, partial [Gammaproteobacteria bacterium]|nr:hypothetical protein [Gammaproteobacteria bacterium]